MGSLVGCGSRSKGDQRAGDLKDKFEAVFGEAITDFVYVLCVCVLCASLLKLLIVYFKELYIQKYFSQQY